MTLKSLTYSETTGATERSACATTAAIPADACPRPRSSGGTHTPWTWQVDYHGLAGIVHCLLFGRYMETTAQADGPADPGLVLTGDVGWVDAGGWLTMVDRKKLMIVRGGANVSPAEVEGVLLEHPSVAAAVVGIV